MAGYPNMNVKYIETYTLCIPYLERHLIIMVPQFSQIKLLLLLINPQKHDALTYGNGGISGDRLNKPWDGGT